MMPAPIRAPAVAGTFYPADPDALRREVRALLDAAAPAPGPAPKALIVPHAGYVYSGAIAASAYASLASRRDVIRRVVLLGPAHRVAVQGLALPEAGAFATPLGVVPIDTAALDAARLPQVVRSDAAHAAEHALEVQLPFLQSVLGEFTLLPLCVGHAAPAAIAAVLDACWGGDETLVVISSDLSHYLPYAQARQHDGHSVDAIVNLHDLDRFEQACGALPINGLLQVARRRGLRPRLLDLRSSGDTAGDRAAVVGYAAIAFAEPEPAPLGDCLLSRARNAIAASLELPPWAEDWHAELAAPGATFVTLTRDGQLRGCIGSLQAHRALEDDVRANARAAAFHDPRFPALRRDELEHIGIEVSRLAAPQRLPCADEADALRQLRPGHDGIILVCGDRRATFLPQVWEQLPEPAAFMRQLKAKAGLAADFWSDGIELHRYEVEKWTQWTRPPRR